MPNEALKYFNTSRRKGSTSGKRIVFSTDEIQNRNTVLCVYWCLYYLLERQMGTSILDVIHNPHFDNDNSDFIKAYFSGGLHPCSVQGPQRQATKVNRCF